MMTNFIAILLISCVLCGVESAKILGIFPTPGRSHYILGSSLFRELAERGHDVTVVSSFGEKDPPKNYKDIVLTGFDKLFQDNKKHSNTEFDMFQREKKSPFIHAFFLGYVMANATEMFLSHENFQKLIKSNEKFDVVIVEQFLNDAFKALAAHFDAPLVLFNTVAANLWVNILVGNPAPLSYVPNHMLDCSTHMSFFERAKNAALNIFTYFLYTCYYFPKHNELIKKYIPNGPDIDDVLYNVSLVLLNSHPSFSHPVPLVPNMIEVGGLHIKPPQKLPADIQEFLDNAKEGVIYFNMGSNLQSSTLPIEKREAFLRTFAKLKLKVLWKFEEELPNQPANIKISNWIPQRDVLAHPNVKLFISHSGHLSTTEAVYRGVPVLSIPIIGDQKYNAKLLASHEMALTLYYRDISEETLTEKLTELLTNPKYRENAQWRSRLFQDNLKSPMDTAIYWVEYVIRHRGTPHLRVAALDLPWYKYLLLDVIAFVGLCWFLLMAAFYVLLKKICHRRTQRNKNKKD